MHCTNHWGLSAHWQACHASTPIHITALQSAVSGQKRNRAGSDEALVQAELQHDCSHGSAQHTDPPCRLSHEQWLSVKGTVQTVKVAADPVFRLLTAYISSSPSLSKASMSSKLCRLRCGWQHRMGTCTFHAFCTP